MKKLGKDKRRVWRKLHIAVDADTHQIVATELPKSAAKYILGIVLPKVIQHHDVIDDSVSEIANEIFDLIPE